MDTKDAGRKGGLTKWTKVKSKRQRSEIMKRVRHGEKLKNSSSDLGAVRPDLETQTSPSPQKTEILGSHTVAVTGFHSAAGGPSSFLIGDDLNWSAPWVDVSLRVELPFWLMVNNTTIGVEVEGHEFKIDVHDNYCQLYGGVVTDSRFSVVHEGPWRKLDELSDNIQQKRKSHPDLTLMWRKCKTILKVATRCNEQVWNAAISEKGLRESTVRCYLEELCKAHIPVVNKLVQAYRLATYDYFAFEVAPWDVPRWLIDRGGHSINSLLLPYRGFDAKPMVYERGAFSFKPPVGPTRQPVPYQLISGDDLRTLVSAPAAPGEFELLDAMNFMERGDYSGAVRRIATAIEVIVEAQVAKEIESLEGKQRARKFIKATRIRFDRRVSKYEALTKRTLPEALRKRLKETRTLRHRIVHQGYRVSSGERGRTQRLIDMGRWTFNWFENDATRQKLREGQPAHRSLGRDLSYGIFPTKITPEGVVVSSVGEPIR
jgi:hypothetical protein